MIYFTKVSSRRSIVALSVSLLSLLTLAACGQADTANVAAMVRPAYVSTARDRADAALSFVGEVRAARRAELSFAVAGSVTRVLAEVGDAVRAGQILAKLDDRPLQAQLTAATAEAQRLQAQLAETRQRVERMRQAQQADAASAAEWSAVQTELAAAESALRGAQAQREHAAWTLENASLRAPMDGVVALRSIERGQAAAPGAPVLVIDGSGRELAIPLPVNVAIAVGQPVTLNGDGATQPSRVLRVAGRLDAGGVRKVWLAVPDAAAVGSTWSASVQGTALGGLQVPLRAVMPTATADGGASTGAALRLAKDGQTLEAVALKLGAVNDDWIEVLSGLKAGDRVVVAGAQGLRPGQKISPIEVAR